GISRKAGGAGGIRTHEWRFCRPLPWATWVPRRNGKYNETTAILHSEPYRTVPIACSSVNFEFERHASLQRLVGASEMAHERVHRCPLRRIFLMPLHQ